MPRWYYAVVRPRWAGLRGGGFSGYETRQPRAEPWAVSLSNRRPALRNSSRRTKLSCAAKRRHEIATLPALPAACFTGLRKRSEKSPSRPRARGRHQMPRQPGGTVDR